MFIDKDITQILCIDIETVPQYPHYDDLPEIDKALFDERTRFMDKKELDNNGMYQRQGGIWAEFGRVICVCIGVFRKPAGEKDWVVKIKTFNDVDEKVLLTNMFEWLNKYFNDDRKYVFAGHNIKEFDMPYICRRALAHGMATMPALLNLSGKKPWEVGHIDTMEKWKFGDYKSYISLKLLCHVLQVPTSKDDIDGSKVAGVYWNESGLDRISAYCKKDVQAVAQLVLRLKGLPLLEDNAFVEM